MCKTAWLRLLAAICEFNRKQLPSGRGVGWGGGGGVGWGGVGWGGVGWVPAFQSAISTPTKGRPLEKCELGRVGQYSISIH